VTDRSLPPAALAPRELDDTSDDRARITLPNGLFLDLPGRGSTFVRHIVGPPNAPTVLLLHGWTATADLNWFTSYEMLSERYSVLALDHHGHGRGLRNGEPFRLADCADDAVAVLDAFDIEQAIVVGYSMGGPITQLLWRRHPGRTRGLVLCATAATFNTTSREKALFTAVGSIAAAARITPKPLRELTGLRILTGRADRDLRQWAYSEIARHDWLRIIQAGREIGRFDSRRWIRSLDVPASTIVTTADEIILPRRQLALAGMLPDVEIFEVHGPHSSCISEARHFTASLCAALTSVEARTS
jgi:3-oxoadipate enol-lactonase